LAVHPTDGDAHYQLYLTRDDVYATVEELQDKGIKFP
jgi:hypothetical protein